MSRALILFLAPLVSLALVSPTAAGPPRPPEGGRVLWRFEIPSTVSGQHIGVGGDGRVYTTSFTPPNLYALTPQGTLIWSLAIGESGYWPISFASDGTIYTGAAPGVRAVNPDGTLRWSFDIANWMNAGPSVSTDGNIYAENDGLGFFSLDPDGNLRWSIPGDPAVLALSFEADEVVFGEGRHFGGVHPLKSGPWISTYALDLGGHQLWYRNNVGLQGGPSSNPRRLLDGRLVFRWAGGSLAALHQDGTDDWIVPHPDGAQQLVTPAVGPDGAIYAGDAYGVQLWSINSDGTTRWVHDANGAENLGSTGLGVSPDNRVLIASGWTWSESEGVNHGWVRGYDPADGALLWQIDLELEQGLTQIARTVRPAFSLNGDTAYLTTWFTGNGVGHTYLYAIALREPTADVPAGDHGGRGPLLVCSPNPCFGPLNILLTGRSAGPASVTIYDVAGREVRRLFEGYVASGGLRLGWDLSDGRKQAVDSGVYFISAQTPDGRTTTRIAVTK